jgi:hypothetical protein
LKHKFTITYETDGLPICPDAIHKLLATTVVSMKKKFATKYAKLPGLHKLWLEPCGPWFPEQQKPMRFELQASGDEPQAASYKQQAASNGRLKKATIKWYKEIERKKL